MIKFAVKVEEELSTLFTVRALFVICRPTFVFELFPFFVLRGMVLIVPVLDHCYLFLFVGRRGLKRAYSSRGKHKTSC